MITLKTKRVWRVIDASKVKSDEDCELPAGEYEMERIANPRGHSDAPWFVLKGTKKGRAEMAWRQHIRPDDQPPSDFDVEIIEDGAPLAPDNG
ncbi:MAG: hypothetical protein PHT12_04400 [Patescibacteria group bacterium]|nr:hypothetical protein [Patescibacteria group bacterium]